MSTPSELVAAYLLGIEQLRHAVRDMSMEQLRAKPIAGKMSTLEVVAHLADFEPILADRMKRIIALDKPLLFAADENRFLERLAYAQRDLEEELALITSIRKQMARILSQLPPEAFDREGVHSEKGLVTLAKVLQSAINHIPHHIKFIQEKRAALGLPA